MPLVISKLLVGVYTLDHNGGERIASPRCDACDEPIDSPLVAVTPDHDVVICRSCALAAAEHEAPCRQCGVRRPSAFRCEGAHCGVHAFCSRDCLREHARWHARQPSASSADLASERATLPDLGPTRRARS